MNTHTHTHSEQRAEPLCQVAGGGSRLRTSGEEEERLLAGLESERHKRRRRCPGLDAAGGALEGFPGHAGRERQGKGFAGTLFGPASAPWSAPSVTEKCDPRHSCPVLSRTLVVRGPRAAAGTGMLRRAKTGLTHTALFPASALDSK